MRIFVPIYLLTSLAYSADYHVGPGQPLTQIGQVPWYTLRAGDTVYIHYRPEPYREKVLISSRGTETKWIRVLGVHGPKGERPIISGDGALTSKNSHYRWRHATGDSAIQGSGIVQIAYRAGEGAPKPGYIEIANLQIQDGHAAYRFTAEDGTPARYGDFCACIYSRSADHLLIRDNALTNCGLGFYNWTGNDSRDLQTNTVLRGNYFHDNGIPGQYYEHASYTESDRVTIEFNHFGRMKSGALGSQIKDRSAGTIVRYNYIEQPEGWSLDLVEPENGDPTLSSRPYFKQTWVYGNALLNIGTSNGPLLHWNEDHGAGKGRADTGGTLFFYNNTVAVVRDEPEIWKFALFSVNSGGGSCTPSTRGVIDARNNIWANLSRTPGANPPLMFFAACGIENFVFGKNWVSPGWKHSFYREYSGRATGTELFVSPKNNNPGFLDLFGKNLRLVPGSSAVGIGSNLAPEVTSNLLGLDLTPRLQYYYSGSSAPRAGFGPGSDAGAIESEASRLGRAATRSSLK